MDKDNNHTDVGFATCPQTFLYNVTMKMDKNIADDCLQWLLAVHAPQMVATGCFTHFRVFHLLNLDDSEGPTYAIQYFGDLMDDYQRYAEELEAYFLNEIHKMWGGRLALFGTIMKAVN